MTTTTRMTEGAVINNLNLEEWIQMNEEIKWQQKVIHQQKEEIDILKGANPNIKVYVVKGKTGWFEKLSQKECGQIICQDVKSIKDFNDLTERANQTAKAKLQIDKKLIVMLKMKEMIKDLQKIKWWNIKSKRKQLKLMTEWTDQ